MQALVDDIVTVSEAQIGGGFGAGPQAKTGGTGGALGVAALLSGRCRLPGQNVVALLCVATSICRRCLASKNFAVFGNKLFFLRFTMGECSKPWLRPPSR